MKFTSILLAILAIGWITPAPLAADKLKVLVVTGGHGFAREPFFKMFVENPGIVFSEAKHKDKSSAYDREDLYTHDVVVLYDMPKEISETQKQRFLGLFERAIGLVALHHSLVSYQHWPEHERIIGGHYPEADGKSGIVTAEVGYEHDVKVPISIIAKDHPVTRGLADFVLHDEIYWGFRVGKDVIPLVTTTHPKSGKPLGWYRNEGKSRVIYLQSGHGPEAFENSNYRKLLAQSIDWVARRTGQETKDK